MAEELNASTEEISSAIQNVESNILVEGSIVLIIIGVYEKNKEYMDRP